jgi:hypothetical protein
MFGWWAVLCQVVCGMHATSGFTAPGRYVFSWSQVIALCFGRGPLAMLAAKGASTWQFYGACICSVAVCMGKQQSLLGSDLPSSPVRQQAAPVLYTLT